MKKYTWLLFSVALFSGCQNSTNQQGNTEEVGIETSKEEINKPETFASRVEMAHHKEKFHAREAVQFDLKLFFGGTERLNGTLTLLTNSTAGRVDYKDGRTLIYKNGEVYHSKEFSPESASFAAYTWSYFFMLPYKITDAGTDLETTEFEKLSGEYYDTRKLTFAAETGASPDDWYLLYADTATHLLRAAAYIVTANGRSVEKAEEDPHAIEYLDYEALDGVPFATQWKFWGWQPDSNFTKQLGEAKLTNFKFVETETAAFEPTDSLLKVKSF